MSVPTHNLYDFVHQATKKQFLLFYFYPWGSRDLKNICSYLYTDDMINSLNGIPPKYRVCPEELTKYEKLIHLTITFQPTILCHDQEPLNFDLYNDECELVQKYLKSPNIDGRPRNHLGLNQNMNLRYINLLSIQKTWILLHSELNSQQVLKYENTGKFCGAYWWSHAIIARDWYRYAQYDLSLEPQHQYQKLFLMYCRDTTGTRQYRQTLLDQLSYTDILKNCQIQSFDSTSVAESNDSAIYNPVDFNNTAISVVLETIFDSRIHLTEKILRAIACAHPFILAAGPGSLRLLKHYGFKTFDPYINENYDNELDDQKRLLMISNEMKRISTLSKQDQDAMISAIRKIAKFNQERFFSSQFHKQIVQELQDNVKIAYDKGHLDLDTWWQRRQTFKKSYTDLKLHQPGRSRETNQYLIKLYRQQRLSNRLKTE
jgi:hypothetical protein